MKPKKNERFLFVCDQAAKELGQETLARLLRRVGVDPKQQDKIGITAQQEATLIREVCRSLGDITFAARAGQEFRQAHTLTAYIARSSGTLRQAIENSARFYVLADPAIEFRLFRTDERDAIGVSSTDGALLRHHRFQEFLVFGLLARLRTLAGADFHPHKLCFRHEVGTDPRVFEKFVDGPVEFGGDFNGIVFGKTTLDMPLANHDPDLVEYLSELGAAQLKKGGYGMDSLRARIEKLIIERLPGHVLSADEVAVEIGLSRRTVTRQLGTENTSFREVVEDLRFDLAKTYLADGLSISEIAFYLGYGDHAAFSTAFRRWAGVSPRDYMKAL